SAEVARAAPDGYTWLFGPDSLVTVNPHVYKAMTFKVDDLVPVTIATQFNQTLVCNPAVGVKTVAELVAKAKAEKMSYASGGGGGGDAHRGFEEVGHGGQAHPARARLSSVGLERFVEAQAPLWPSVLRELAAGRKTSHWMWFVFPQLKALGRSAMARRYGLEGRAEALDYWRHRLLGPRLLECTRLVLATPPPE